MNRQITWCHLAVFSKTTSWNGIIDQFSARSQSDLRTPHFTFRWTSLLLCHIQTSHLQSRLEHFKQSISKNNKIHNQRGFINLPRTFFFYSYSALHFRSNPQQFSAYEICNPVLPLRGRSWILISFLIMQLRFENEGVTENPTPDISVNGHDAVGGAYMTQSHKLTMTQWHSTCEPHPAANCDFLTHLRSGPAEFECNMADFLEKSEVQSDMSPVKGPRCSHYPRIERRPSGFQSLCFVSLSCWLIAYISNQKVCLVCNLKIR